MSLYSSAAPSGSWPTIWAGEPSTIENGGTINHKNYNSLQIKAIVVNGSGEEQVTEKWELLSTTGLLDNQVGELKDSSDKIFVPNTNGAYELTFAPSNNS